MNLAKNWKNLCLGSVALLATVTLVACGTSTSSSKKSAGNADLNKNRLLHYGHLLRCNHRLMN